MFDYKKLKFFDAPWVRILLGRYATNFLYLLSFLRYWDITVRQIANHMTCSKVCVRLTRSLNMNTVYAHENFHGKDVKIYRKSNKMISPIWPKNYNRLGFDRRCRIFFCCMDLSRHIVVAPIKWHPHKTVTLLRNQLQLAQDVKYMGLHLDRRLTLKKHVSAKRKKFGLQLNFTFER